MEINISFNAFLSSINSLQSKHFLRLEENEKNKDQIIQEKEQKIQNLKYKIKDTQETYEVRQKLFFDRRFLTGFDFGYLVAMGRNDDDD